jgi:acyl-CoA reductase-like NAD-dependent aldehyde dehydrogenase
VQILQALVAGNAACVKPAPGREPPLVRLAELLAGAGLPDGLLHVLQASHTAGEAAVRAGFDKVFLTGSAATGARVLAAAAPMLTPTTMELSGNDPVFVLPGADLNLVAECLCYGLRLNGGETCIAPRRVFVTQADAPALARALAARLPAAGSMSVPETALTRVAESLAGPDGGAIRVLAPDGPIVLAAPGPALAALTDDMFAPVLCLLTVADMEAALAIADTSPYALGAAVFGPDPAARALAGRVRAGSVVLNDLIVPTADPRLPFGGRGRSGFGVTRGAEGLLEMTAIKTVSARTGRFRPHLRNPGPGEVGGAGGPDRGDPGQIAALIQAMHGSGTARLRGLAALVRSARR